MLSAPSSVIWPSNFNIEANKIYQISFLENLATVLSWDL
jgi:hypothetical protein